MVSSEQIHLIAHIVVTLMHSSMCVELPPVSINNIATSSFEIKWQSAPDPGYAIKQYEVSLEYPPGTPSAGSPVRITASAGASHTFNKLEAAQEYGVRLDAILQDDTSAGLNVHDSVWTLPYPPTNVVFYRKSDRSGTLTWTAATPPIDYYELVLTPAGLVGEEVNVPKEAHTIELRYLLAGKTYDFQLTSVVYTPLSTKHHIIRSEPAMIQIAEDPSDYTITVTSITATHLVLSWQQNQTDGNPDSYRLTVVDPSGLSSTQTDTWPLSGHPDLRVTDLIPGTEYSISVEIITNGIATTVASLRQSTRPLPPAAIVLQENNVGRLALNWFPPLQGNVDNYVIRYGPYGVEESLQQYVVASDVRNYQTLPLADKSLQYTVKLYSSVGPNQELLSDEGAITTFGDFSLVVNPSCNQSPCLNDATCDEDPSTGYTCTCPAGFTGLQCETEVIDPCDSHHCENGGQCVAVEAQLDVIKCSCQLGFTGKLCEIGGSKLELVDMTLWVVVVSVLCTLFFAVVIFAIVTALKKKTNSVSPDLISPEYEVSRPADFFGPNREQSTSFFLNSYYMGPTESF